MVFSQTMRIYCFNSLLVSDSPPDFEAGCRNLLPFKSISEAHSRCSTSSQRCWTGFRSQPSCFILRDNLLHFQHSAIFHRWPLYRHSQVPPHQTGKTISSWTWLCAQGTSPYWNRCGTNRQTVPIKLEAHENVTVRLSVIRFHLTWAKGSRPNR